MPPLMCPETAPIPAPTAMPTPRPIPGKIAASSPERQTLPGTVPCGRLVLVVDLDLAVGSALQDRSVEVVADTGVVVQGFHGLVVDLGVRNAVVGPCEDHQRVLVTHRDSPSCR